MRPQFLLDENMDRAIQRQLQRLNSEIDVRLVGDAEAPPRGTPDPDILMWMEHNDYILVTKNRKTMPKHFIEHLAVGGHVPRVLCVRKSVTMAELINLLYLIWYASDVEEYHDKLTFIPL
jgi:predicted nuclease of predicted toxin-antitoxin system